MLTINKLNNIFRQNSYFEFTCHLQKKKKISIYIQMYLYKYIYKENQNGETVQSKKKIIKKNCDDGTIIMIS